MFSEREGQMLKMAACGHTDVAIANKLGISETTVKTYWRRIRQKAGPYSRTELVATLMREEMGRTVQALKHETEKSPLGVAAEADFYRQLIDNAPDAIFVVADDGCIEMLNTAAAEMFGYSQPELVGAHVSKLLPERYRAHHGEHVDEYVSNPERREMGEHLATSALDKNGCEFPVAASLSAIRCGSKTHVMCIVRSLRWKK